MPESNDSNDMPQGLLNFWLALNRLHQDPFFILVFACTD